MLRSVGRARRLYYVVECHLPRIEKEAAVESPFGRSGGCFGRRVNQAAGGPRGWQALSRLWKGRGVAGEISRLPVSLRDAQ